MKRLRSPGPYRGQVVDINDPEQRHRVRVRCSAVHTDKWPVEGLPWAEVVAPTGKYAGSFFGYRPGELVWVMFEEMEVDYPVVIGGINSESLGVPDEPVANQSDYLSGLKRTVHVDRRGNRMELSEVADELHVRLASGGAEIVVSQIGDEIIIKSLGGKVSVQGTQVEVNASHASITAPVVDIDGTGEDRFGVDSGEANLASNDRVNINAQDELTGVSGEVAIGGHVPISRFAGVIVPPSPPLPKQSPKVSLNSRTINIGVGVAGTAPPPLAAADPLEPSDAFADFDREILPKLPTLAINIRCAGSINLNATGPLTISNGLTPLQIKSLGTVMVSAPIVDLNADVSTTVRSSLAVTLRAPAINLLTA